MATPIRASLSGQQFGRLRAIASPYKSTAGLAVNTLCTCGIESPILVANLISGRTKSCGCLAREVGDLLRPTDTAGNLKYSATREYRAFVSAMQRCVNPKAFKYATCGGAGIKFAPEWIGDFPTFFRDLGPAAPGQVLIRKDLHGNYTPANCTWGSWTDLGTAMKERRRTVRPSLLPLAA